MKLTVRGDNIKVDAEARQLIIKALNDAATSWLKHIAGGTADSPATQKTLADVGNVKGFASLLEPKPDGDAG